MRSADIQRRNCKRLLATFSYSRRSRSIGCRHANHKNCLRALRATSAIAKALAAGAHTRIFSFARCAINLRSQKHWLPARKPQNFSSCAARYICVRKSIACRRAHLKIFFARCALNLRQLPHWLATLAPRQRSWKKFSSGAAR